MLRRRGARATKQLFTVRGRAAGARQADLHGHLARCSGRSSGSGFRVSGFGFRVPGFGFWGLGFEFLVSGFGFRVSGFGFSVPGFRLGRGKLIYMATSRDVPAAPQVPGYEFRVTGYGLRVTGFGFRASGSRFRVSGFGSRVSGFGCQAGARQVDLHGHLARCSGRSPGTETLQPKPKPFIGRVPSLSEELTT